MNNSRLSLCVISFLLGGLSLHAQWGMPKLPPPPPAPPLNHALKSWGTRFHLKYLNGGYAMPAIGLPTLPERFKVGEFYKLEFTEAGTLKGDLGEFSDFKPYVQPTQQIPGQTVGAPKGLFYVGDGTLKDGTQAKIILGEPLLGPTCFQVTITYGEVSFLSNEVTYFSFGIVR